MATTDKKLANKVAVITGGNSGIGLATAKLYHEQGAKVVITARSEESFNAAKSEYDSVFDIVKTDVRKDSELKALAEHVKSKYGKIDILFANAGVAHFIPLNEITEENFHLHFDTNVKGVLFAVKHFQPLFNEGASVIINTSAVATKGLAAGTIYSATKAAARSLARTLSAELVGQKVRVNTIAPGPVETPIYEKMGMTKEQLDGFAQQIASITPMARFAQAEEMAKVALFLGSDDSSYLLGAEIVADGGFSQL